MQEVFGKMIEEITISMKRPCREENCESEESCCENKAFMKAIEIVRKAAAEYNNGWILCSERLPENNQEVIACFAHGTVTTLQFYDNRFHGIYDYDEKVIVAWKPLPEPYQPERVKAYKKKTNSGEVPEQNQTNGE